jgi:hypothetical protein
VREQNATNKSQMFSRTGPSRKNKECRMSVTSTSTSATAFTTASWSHPSRSQVGSSWATESVMSTKSLPSYLNSTSYLNSMNLPALKDLDETWFSQVVDTSPFCHGGTIVQEGRHLDVRPSIELKYGVDCSSPEHPIPDLTYRLPNSQDSPTGKRVKPPTRYNGFMSPYSDARLKTNRGGFLDMDSWSKSLPGQRTTPSKTLRLSATGRLSPTKRSAGA